MSHMKEELQKDVIGPSGLLLQEEAFLSSLFDIHKGNIRAAMDASGYPKDTPTSVVTKKLGKIIQEMSRDYMAASTARATLELVGTFNDPTAPGVKNVLVAAKEVLDRGGVYKEERVQVQDESSMFILPAKKDSEEDN